MEKEVVSSFHQNRLAFHTQLAYNHEQCVHALIYALSKTRRSRWGC